jgi:osmotically-inducible protein OsmY
VGIVSRRDLLRTLIRDDDVIAAEVSQRVTAYTGGRADWQVTVTDGQVDLHGEVDDDAEERVLLVLAGTVPGVSHVALHRR